MSDEIIKAVGDRLLLNNINLRHILEKEAYKIINKNIKIDDNNKVQ